MKTAILFASKHGTTIKVAHSIKHGLGEDAILFNLQSDKLSDLSLFDNLVIGGSIHAGGIQKKVKDFCEKNILVLLEKRVCLFLCCMDEGEKAMSHFNKSYPELLRKHSICNRLVGGEFILGKMNFLEKVIIKKISGIDQNVSKIDNNKVQEIISTVCAES